MTLLSIALIMIIIFQKSNSEGIISTTYSPSTVRNATSIIRKITILLIFCFFTNSLFLARHGILTQKDAKTFINSLEGSRIIQNNHEKNIHVPLLN